MKGQNLSLFTSLIAVFIISVSQSHAVEYDSESLGKIDRTKTVRIRSLDGEVFVKTASDAEWIRAHEYMILTEKYRVSTGSGGFVEIELDSVQFIRLRENSEISIFDLNSHTAVFRYITGGVYVSTLENRMRGIEFDLGPMRRAVFFGQGAFRIDEDGYGGTEVTVREGKIALEHEAGTTYLREGQMGSINGNVMIRTARGKDTWDDFVQQRDDELLALTNNPYIYEEIPGRYETYGYSEWVAYPAYGYFWWPHVSLLFIGHHGHHLHSGLSVGIYGGHYYYGGHRHHGGRHLHERRHLHKRHHLHGRHHLRDGRHVNERLHLHRENHKGRRSHRNRSIHKSRIFRRGEFRNKSIHRGKHFRKGRSRSGGHVKKWRGRNKSRIFSRGKSFRGRSFRGGGKSLRMSRGGFRGGRGRR